MSFKAMQWVLELDDVFGTDKAVLFFLAYRDHHDEPHGCYPSLTRLAKDCGLDRSTVIRSIARLVETGKIKTSPRLNHKGEKSSNYYTFPQVWVVAQRDYVGAERDHGSRTQKPRVVAHRNSNLKRLTVKEPSRSALPIPLPLEEDKQFKDNFLAEMKRIAGAKGM